MVEALSCLVSLIILGGKLLPCFETSGPLVSYEQWRHKIRHGGNSFRKSFRRPNAAQPAATNHPHNLASSCASDEPSMSSRNRASSSACSDEPSMAARGSCSIGSKSSGGGSAASLPGGPRLVSEGSAGSSGVHLEMPDPPSAPPNLPSLPSGISSCTDDARDE